MRTDTPSQVASWGENTVASARALRDIARELKGLSSNPPQGIRVLMPADDSAESIASIHAEIDGPEGTPYHGGTFRMRLNLGADFPNHPPKGFFVTPIFHPNIAKNGEICVNTLKRDWKPTLGLRHVLVVIRCLLIEPYPESALNEEAGKMLMDDYDEYARHARLMTSIHAPLSAAAVAERRRQEGSCSAAQSSSASAADFHSTTQSQALELGSGSGSNRSGGGGRGGTGSSSSSAQPLGLNSSIANSDRSNCGDAAAAGKQRGSGSGSSSGSGKSAAGASDGQKKKPVDARKKALKRL